MNSKNNGNFLEILQFVCNNNEEIDKVLKKSCGNLKLVSPSIQKDIVKVATCETTKFIIDDLNSDLFSILIDKSRDISVKEQMVVLCYVDKKRCVIERFLGIVHVANTSDMSLKSALESLLAKYNLSFSIVRGQGYDGAINNLSNVVGASCKRRDILRESKILKVMKALESGESLTGRGLNPKTTLTRAGDTIWGYITERLQTMREYGWSSLLDEVTLFYEKHSIDIINMDDAFMLHGKPRHNVEIVSNTTTKALLTTDAK
ncbi:uncharacterized protein LOC131659321 [Vicia villosa]|uniref:uncharacterized protein LOC131659321 n=1 Tax=Vicia villosa TaxID=3911 RepID=UPI00273C4490|nr:uncharacterized protein LOC131659321 [Vicia villosa]